MLELWIVAQGRGGQHATVDEALQVLDMKVGSPVVITCKQHGNGYAMLPANVL